MCRLPVFWRFQLGGWGALFVLTFPVKLSVSGDVGESLCSFGIRDGFSFCLTLAMRWVYAPVCESHSSPLRIAVVVSLVCLSAAFLQIFFFIFADRVFSFEGQTIFGQSALIGTFYYRLGLFVGWSLLYFGIRQMLDGIERDRHLASIELEKRGAELQLLRAQMNPHFLFNALTMIQVGIARREPHLDEVVQAMAQYLRYSLENRHNDRVPLGNEFDAIHGFLIVEKARFREELQFECHIDESAREKLAPGVIMQPLVENALKHGRKTSPPPLRVRLRVLLTAEHTIRIEIANTGQWISTEILNQTSGVGLENLEKRLQLLYPGTHSLRHHEENGWVTVQIEFPATP